MIGGPTDPRDRFPGQIKIYLGLRCVPNRRSGNVLLGMESDQDIIFYYILIQI